MKSISYCLKSDINSSSIILELKTKFGLSFLRRFEKKIKRKKENYLLKYFLFLFKY